MITAANILALSGANDKLYNIIVYSFILPWFIGIFIYFKDRQAIIVTAPFSSALAFVLNTIGIDLGYFHPLQSGNINYHTVSVFANAGLLPVESCIFIYAVSHTRINPFVLNLLLTPAATLIDHIFIKAGLLKYDNGWNLTLSFLMYYITFIAIYFYYMWVQRNGEVSSG